jgi:uncharacterized protein (TIGR00369 family)
MSKTQEWDWSTREGLQAIVERTPIHRHLEFRCSYLDRVGGVVVFSAPLGDAAQRSDGAGQAHGGVLATLIDSAATFAACVAAGRSVPTAGLHVDYLRPASGADMVATATVRKLGRSAAVVDVEVMSGGKLVALGRVALATGAGN